MLENIHLFGFLVLVSYHPILPSTTLNHRRPLPYLAFLVPPLPLKPFPPRPYSHIVPPFPTPIFVVPLIFTAGSRRAHSFVPQPINPQTQCCYIRMLGLVANAWQDGIIVNPLNCAAVLPLILDAMNHFPTVDAFTREVQNALPNDFGRSRCRISFRSPSLQPLPLRACSSSQNTVPSLMISIGAVDDTGTYVNRRQHPDLTSSTQRMFCLCGPNSRPPPEAPRLTMAISRPPFHVADSRT
jgi:hypothetical protein